MRHGWALNATVLSEASLPHLLSTTRCAYDKVKASSMDLLSTVPHDGSVMDEGKFHWNSKVGEICNANADGMKRPNHSTSEHGPRLHQSSLDTILVTLQRATPTLKTLTTNSASKTPCSKIRWSAGTMLTEGFDPTHPPPVLLVRCIHIRGAPRSPAEWQCLSSRSFADTV